MRQKIDTQEGFTIIEVLVTLAVAGLFLAAIFQLHIVQSQLTASTIAYTNADMLAYNNLRTFAYGKAPTWFECTYTGSVPDSKDVLESSGSVSGIPGPVAQKVTAYAPFGCGGGSSGIGYPIKIVSTVTYGPTGRTVTHATYATY